MGYTYPLIWEDGLACLELEEPEVMTKACTRVGEMTQTCGMKNSNFITYIEKDTETGLHFRVRPPSHHAHTAVGKKSGEELRK